MIDRRLLAVARDCSKRRQRKERWWCGCGHDREELHNAIMEAKSTEPQGWKLEKEAELRFEVAEGGSAILTVSAY